MTTNLVVADSSRTDKTICLAVSPSLKVYGIPGRARLFEVVQKIKEANNKRKAKCKGSGFIGESYDSKVLESNPDLAISYVVATPQIAKYMRISTEIYGIYLKHVAPEDIHVYSIDEVFIDATHYLDTYKCSARELALRMIRDVLKITGITATAGIGTNLYLAKIAMDIIAKKMPSDKDGVRIAELDERSYREKLWSHKPLTSFWRIGKGIAAKLETYGMYTMGDVARRSIYDEELFYKLFGVNAELLIDHAWGWEPCLISDIKAYKPESSSICSGQVLPCPYDFDKTRLIIREMLDLLALNLVEKRLVTGQIVLDIGYDVECLTDPRISREYSGTVVTDHYGRKVPKPAHGTVNIGRQTSSSMLITKATLDLFDRIVNRNLTVRRVTVTACNTVDESTVKESSGGEQIDFFTDIQSLEKEKEVEDKVLKKERKNQETILGLKKKYGKNAVLKGMNLEEGATTIERNGKVGGHKA